MGKGFFGGGAKTAVASAKTAVASTKTAVAAKQSFRYGRCMVTACIGGHWKPGHHCRGRKTLT